MPGSGGRHDVEGAAPYETVRKPAHAVVDEVLEQGVGRA